MRNLSLRIVLSFLAMMLGVVGTAAVAQTSVERFTSELSGVDISIGTSGEASFVPEWHDVYSNGSYIQEDIYIQRGATEIAIYIVDGNVSPATWEEDSLASLVPTYIAFEIIDEEIGEEASWSLYRGTYLLSFSEVGYGEFERNGLGDYHLSVFLIGHESTLLEDIAWIQENITVDGGNVLTDTDISRVESGINGTATPGPLPITAYETTVADWNNEGLLASDEWKSPQTGAVLIWDENSWSLQFNRSNAITIDTNYPRDGIRLITPDFTGQLLIYVSDDPEFGSVDDWVEWWQSSEYLDEQANFGNHLTVHQVATSENTGSVIFTAKNHYGEELMVIYDIYIDENGRMIFTQIFSTESYLVETYTDFWDGVQADGDYYPLTWTIEEIEALLSD